MSMLAPPPKFTVYTTDADGYAVPLALGKIYTYAAGTSTPKATYTSYTLGTPNANPVELDAEGQADIWLDGSYKITVKDSTDVQLYSVDNIHDLTKDQTFTGTTLAGTLTITSTAVTWSGNPTHSGNHTFTNNLTVNGNTTLGDAGADALTVRPNAVTWTNNPTHSGNHTWSGTQTFSSAITALSGAFSGALSASTLLSGTYTPTLTNDTNIAASTPYLTTYSRSGNMVSVAGVVDIDPTSASVFTALLMTLPIASALANAQELCGTAVRVYSGTSNVCASIVANPSNDKALLQFLNDTDVANRSWSFHFSYRVI